MAGRSQLHLRETWGADSSYTSGNITGTRSPTTVTDNAAAVTAVTVTIATVPAGKSRAGISVRAASDDVAAATVEPEAITNDAGEAVFNITNVATGTATVSFTVATGATIGTVAVTTN